MCDKLLRKLGYKTLANHSEYVYAPGKIPICIVAHVDTVHIRPPEDIVYDATAGIIWSPDGIGGDDRIGVWSIFELLQRGFRPHVLFTTDEERGCLGAKAAGKKLKAPDVNCLIELDRMNRNDAVFYSCDNRDYVKWVESFGWKEENGSCSDISSLMPDWGIAGVNLSVGYYRQHSTTEHIRFNETLAMIHTVSRMFAKPPEFMKYESKYKSIVYTGGSSGPYSGSNSGYGFHGGFGYNAAQSLDEPAASQYPVWRQDGANNWVKLENKEEWTAYKEKELSRRALEREEQEKKTRATRGNGASSSNLAQRSNRRAYCASCHHFMTLSDTDDQLCNFCNSSREDRIKETRVIIRVPVKDSLPRRPERSDFSQLCKSCENVYTPRENGICLTCQDKTDKEFAEHLAKKKAEVDAYRAGERPGEKAPSQEEDTQLEIVNCHLCTRQCSCGVGSIHSRNYCGECNKDCDCNETFIVSQGVE